MDEAERLNADGQAGLLNRPALQQQVADDEWYGRFGGRGLFADVAVFVRAADFQQMQEVIGAVERAITVREETSGERSARGVFYGYDFHLNAGGAHLIEINTNAGGAFLNALLVESQRGEVLPGAAVGGGIEQGIVDMFRTEWQWVRGNVPLGRIAIVDEKPQEQYLYPEFLLAQRMFERAGIGACIVDPADLVVRERGLFVGGHRVDLVYNRLTDFSLQHYLALLQAWLQDEVVLTPNPQHYARYAEKRKLALLTDAEGLQDVGVTDADIAILQRGIPHTFEVRADLGERLWDERKQLFFKPYDGYGSRGAYRGDKLTRRVFGEILQSGYVAQQLAVPGERRVGEAMLKYDVRCYVYDGNIQLAAARLYQGQTTNFRTPGGGFAQVRVVG